MPVVLSTTSGFARLWSQSAVTDGDVAHLHLWYWCAFAWGRLQGRTQTAIIPRLGLVRLEGLEVSPPLLRALRYSPLLELREIHRRDLPALTQRDERKASIIMSRPWQPGGAFLMQIPHASTPPPRQARFGPGYGLKPSTPQRPGIKPGLDGNQVLGAPFYPVMNPPSAHPSAQTEFMRKSLKSSPTKESSLNDAIEPNVYKRSGFEERPIAEWQRERAVGHPSKRLGRYTRHASNRSWLEVDLEWQQSMKTKARELNIRPYSLTTTANFSNRPPDVDGWTASAVGDGEDDEGYTSASYDYRRIHLPPSPFSPRVSPRASKTAPTGGSPSPNASPSASPSRGGSPESLAPARKPNGPASPTAPTSRMPEPSNPERATARALPK